MLARFIALGCLLPFFAGGQQFDNIKAVPEAGKLIITYDLVSDHPDQTYTVSVYASHNNFAGPVANVTGNVGKSQKPGTNKRIEWDMKPELQSFRGQIVIELGGAVEITRLSFKTFPSKAVRRGKTSSIDWQGGTTHPMIRAELFRDGRPVQHLGDRKNTGMYNWDVSKDLEKGEGYTMKLIAGDESVESKQFAVKAKIPLALKLLPIPIIGGIILIILNGREEDELPLAPGPDGIPTN